MHNISEMFVQCNFILLLAGVPGVAQVNKVKKTL